MKRKLELIDYSFIAISLGYLFVVYKYFVQNTSVLSWFGDVVGPVFGLLFLVGIILGLVVIFNKESEHDAKYWVLVGLEAITAVAIVVALGNLGNMHGGNRNSVDPNNPEAIVNAYFEDWRRGDWSEQKSLMDQKYKTMSPEPMESITVDSLKLISSSDTKRIYAVSFDVQTNGQGASMSTGHYDWTYELTWNTQEKRWVITNYGAG